MAPTIGFTRKATSVPQTTTSGRLLVLCASPSSLATSLGIRIASSACQWKLLANQKRLSVICCQVEMWAGASLPGGAAVADFASESAMVHPLAGVGRIIAAALDASCGV